MKTFNHLFNLTGLTPGDFRDGLYFGFILIFVCVMYLFLLYFESRCKRKERMKTMQSARMMRSMVDSTTVN